jgi:hypothetical protein
VDCDCAKIDALVNARHKAGPKACTTNERALAIVRNASILKRKCY